MRNANKASLARKAAIGYGTYMIVRRAVTRQIDRVRPQPEPRSKRWRKPIAGGTAVALAAGAAGAVAVRQRRRQPVEE
jgi:hypothetical protein